MSLSDYGIQYLLEKAKSYERASSLPELELALKYYNKIIDNTRPHPHYFFKRAKVKYSLSLVSAFHDLDDAIADLDRAIELEPDRGEYYRLRGEYLMLKLTEQQHTSDADRQPLLERIDRDYRSSRERNPTDPQLWLDLIEAAILSHDYDKAIGLYGDSKQFIKTDENKLVRSWLGCIALALAGDPVEDDNSPLYEEIRSLWRYRDSIFPHVLEISSLLKNIRAKEGETDKWYNALEIQQLFDNNFHMTPKSNKYDYIENLDRYNSSVELKPVEDMDLADLIVRSYKFDFDNKNYSRTKSKLEECWNFSESGADDVKAWYNEGVSLRTNGRYNEAIEAFNKILWAKPDDLLLIILAWHHNKKIFESLGYEKESLEAFHVLRDNHWLFEFQPDYVEWYYEYRNKLDECNKAAESVGDDYAIAWYNKGLLLKSNGNYEEAFESFDKLIELNRATANTQKLGTGASILRKQITFRNSEAENAIRITKNQFPLTAYAWFNKGVNHIKSRERALEAYIEGTRFNLKGRKQALEAYDKTIENYGDDIMLASLAFFNKGIILLKLDRQEEAYDAFEKALDLNPGFADALYFKAKLHKHFERFEGALNAYADAVKLKPYYAIPGLAVSALEEKGDLLDQVMKRTNEALNTYDAALQVAEQPGDILLKKAKLLMELEIYVDALDACNKIIKDTGLAQYVGLTHDAWHYKGLIFEKLNRYEEAIDSYDKAISGWLGNMTHCYDLFWNYSLVERSWSRKEIILKALNRYDESQKLLDYEEALLYCDYFIKKLPNHPATPSAWYTRACIKISLKNDKESAFTDLSEAIAMYATYKDKAKKEEAFKDLWDDEGFKRIVE